MTLIAAISTSLAVITCHFTHAVLFRKNFHICITQDLQMDIQNSTLEKKYRGLLLWSLVRPRRAILISLVLPLVEAFLLFSTLKQDFFPANDRNMFQVKIEPKKYLCTNYINNGRKFT